MSHPRRALLGLLAAVAALVVGCSSGHKDLFAAGGNGAAKPQSAGGGGADGPGSDEYAAASIPSPCDLLTGAQVTAAEKWQGQATRKAQPTMGGIKTCTWDYAGNWVTITIESSSRNAFDIDRHTSQADNNAKNVPGVGDEAYVSQGLYNGVHVFTNGMRIVITTQDDVYGAEETKVAVSLLAKI